MHYSALLTDLYQLTMLAGYFERDMHRRPAVFDLFFREAPFKGSYAVFAGLQPALDYLAELRFTEEDLDYLQGLELFSVEFLDYLHDFRFRGRVLAPAEGSLVFGNEPLLTVEAELAEAQLVETALLNIINYQTLVATKAARLTLAAGEGVVVDFGLRRAQGPDGGLSAARGAAVGGVGSSSNVLAGKIHGLPVKGTHAHSWVMAFDDELSAFRAYADCFPDHTVLLVDTYDTLRHGIPNAIRVAGELRQRGHRMLGIRLDSGDLAYLSKEARRLFDEAGLPEVKIVASNELDEHVIEAIRNDGGRIDIYGVGTRLVTCDGVGGGALGGVYKLVRIGDRPTLKTTSDPAKATLPDHKRIWRVTDPDGRFLFDLLSLQEEQVAVGDSVFDPTNPQRRTRIPQGARLQDLRQEVMRDGRQSLAREGLGQMAERCHRQLQKLPEGSLRLCNPHRYRVAVSSGLLELRRRLFEAAKI